MKQKTLLKILTAPMVFLFTFITSTAGFSAPSSEFYKCMSLNVGTENYNWSMFLSRSVPEEIKSTMTVDQIVNARTTQKELELIIKDVAQKNIARFVQNATSSMIEAHEYNFNTEFSHSLRLFSRHLRIRLHQLKNKNWTKPIAFQLMFSPRVSDSLLDRRRQGEVPRLSTYPSDRFLVMEQILDRDSISENFSEEILKLSFAGIQILSDKATLCGQTNPYFVSAMVNINVTPDIENTSIKSQLVIGMPIEQEIVFAQANDQIRFTHILMPQKPKSINGQVSLSNQPMAFVNLAARLNSPQISALIRFGTIGSLSDGGWERSAGDLDRSQVPRLRGIPVGKIKDLLNVEFSVYNIAASIDYSKYQDNAVLEINQLNLYISAGLNSWTDFKLGMINKKEIDEQFKNEINKTIKAKIEEQAAGLKQKSISVTAENTGLNPSEVENLLKTIFTNFNK